MWFTSSWGDNVQACGGDYPPARVDALMASLRNAGVGTVLWRVDGGGRALYHSNVLTPWGPGVQEEPARRDLGVHMERYDPLEVAVAAAHRHGIELFAWTCLFDSKIVRPKRGRHIADPFLAAHPEWWLLSRDGRSRLEGVPCYAYPEVVAYRLGQYRELLGRYGVDGLHLSTRSHAQSNPGVQPGRDAYGYNAPWIDAFRQRYQGLDPRQGLPTRYHADRWTALRGECLTDLLRRARDLTDERRARLSIDIAWQGDQLLGAKEKGEAPVLARRDWPGWVREGQVDFLVVTRDRRDICDVPFLGAFRPHFQAAPARLVVWHNLVVREYDDGLRTVSRLATIEEMRAMRRATVDGPEIDCFHESADIEFHDAAADAWAAVAG